jgi:hypothetical protein
MKGAKTVKQGRQNARVTQKKSGCMQTALALGLRNYDDGCLSPFYDKAVPP